MFIIGTKVFYSVDLFYIFIRFFSEKMAYLYFAITRVSQRSRAKRWYFIAASGNAAIKYRLLTRRSRSEIKFGLRQRTYVSPRA